MFDAPLRPVPTSEWPPPAGVARRPSRIEPSGHRQNAMGDLVIPLERGEIVTLPRLWGFALDQLADGRAVLRGPAGLVAEVALLVDGAVVEHVGSSTGHPLAGAA
jgi:hypothetical protein